MSEARVIQRSVTVIPVTLNRSAQMPIAGTKKRRVAAYARVSTDNEEQLSSYEAQIDYYTQYIKSKEEWEFVDIYADEGISATNTKKREKFNKMIADALAGKIDLIITKSVSRFARNTVDTLTTVRQLKEKGVEVYFEKENIYTLDSKGELLITIMSSLAQEESRSISENVTWGKRKKFADGKVSLPYKQFLGYEKGEDGLPKIVEKEAVIVRMIYQMFLEGKTPSGIAKHLTESGIPSPSGKKKWPASTVESILQNEKYKGDAILQKHFTVDFLNKKMKVNEGEVPQYYVENSHPPIISADVFDLVQAELKRRKASGRHLSGTGCFAGKIICGECGSVFGSKVWHSNSKYRRTIWRCNEKFKNAEKCATPHLYEADLEQAFIKAFNSFHENKEAIVQDFSLMIQDLMDTAVLDAECAKQRNEIDVAFELMHKCVEENAQTALDQEDFQRRYEALVVRYEEAKQKFACINDQKLERSARRENIALFLQRLQQSGSCLTEFDESLWNALVETVTVCSEQDITFRFRNGIELHWKI